MNPVSILQEKAAGANVIDLVSYLKTDNEKLRRAAAELAAENMAFQQSLESAQQLAALRRSLESMQELTSAAGPAKSGKRTF